MVICRETLIKDNDLMVTWNDELEAKETTHLQLIEQLKRELYECESTK